MNTVLRHYIDGYDTPNPDAYMMKITSVVCPCCENRYIKEQVRIEYIVEGEIREVRK